MIIIDEILNHTTYSMSYSFVTIIFFISQERQLEFANESLPFWIECHSETDDDFPIRKHAMVCTILRFWFILWIFNEDFWRNSIWPDFVDFCFHPDLCVHSTWTHTINNNKSNRNNINAIVRFKVMRLNCVQRCDQYQRRAHIACVLNCCSPV